MQNIFKQLDANAISHMNAFDLSQRHIMSTKVGLKNVVCCIDCLPKDYFEFDVLSLTRSLPINTAAFSRMKMTFDAVFVPYQQLWHGWNQFYLQKEEKMSISHSFDHSRLPRVSTHLLASVLHDCVIADALRSLCQEWSKTVTQLDSFFGTSTNTFSEEVCKSTYTSFFYSLDYFDTYDEMGYSRGRNMVRFLDQTGYGSFYELYDGAFHDLFDNLKSHSELIVLTSSGLVDVSASASAIMTFIDTWYPMMFYYQALAPDVQFQFDDAQFISVYNVSPVEFSKAIAFFWDVVKDTTNTYVCTFREVFINPMRALAYQKAYQDFTLNKRQEPYDPVYFNCDALDEIKDDSNAKRLCLWFSFRYDSWEFDLYTGVFNSPQTGDVSIINNQVEMFFKPSSDNGGSQTSEKLLTIGMTDYRKDQEYQIAVGEGAGGFYSDGKFVSKPAVSVYDIKRAEFLQRWKENHLRAGNKLQNQALGQWNTRFKYLADEYSEFVHSWEMPINIDEVINTADNQGEISGKGIGTSNGSFKFSTDDAGVLLIMVSIKPRAEYDALMIDRQNTCLEIGDFPSPFFDNLGLESVPKYLLSQVTDSASRNASLGYTVRYASWKTAVDKVHGSLMSYGYGMHNAGGDLSIWASPRKELESIDWLGDISRMFYVNPNVVDSIFGFASDGTLATDHFILNTNVMCKVVRNLSVSGQLMFGL